METGEIGIRYKLLDAWGGRISTVKVNLSAKNQVHYWKAGGKRKKLTLPPDAVEKVRNLLQDPALYGFKELEQEAACFEILDGTISDVTYTDGKQVQEVYAGNLWAYQVDPGKWPHTAAVKTMLQSLREILEKAGVPAELLSSWV